MLNIQGLKNSVAIVLVIAACGALSGCGDDEKSRVVDLEKRLAAVEGRLGMLERQMVEQAMRNPQRQIVGQRREEGVRQSPLTPEQIAERQRMREEVRKRLEERRDKARAKKGKESIAE